MTEITRNRGLRHGTAFLAFLLAVACGAALLTTGGCGGSGASAGEAATTATGRAEVAVRWPERTRLIPFASESIRVRVVRGSALLGERLLTRPASGGLASTVFARLPTGNVTVQAAAFPAADGSGVVQAQGVVPVIVVGGQTANVRLTLGSTIDRVELAPGNQSLTVGQNVTFTLTARNAAGEVVLISPAKVEWGSSNAAVASVVGGDVTALAKGSAIITATETESGKTASVSVEVTAPVVDPPPGRVKCDPGTGHCYEIVVVAKDTTTFDQIRDAALARTYNGRAGHLATFNSQAEADFLKSALALGSLMIGAYQDRSAADYSESNGGWRWVTGEPWIYTDWRGGEPNNVGGGEDYVKMYSDGQWNDAYPMDHEGYLVEYEP